MRTGLLAGIVMALAVGSAVFAMTAVFAATHSTFHSQYSLAALKTFDFTPQTRISRDPIANNSLWGDDIRNAIASNLTSHGFIADGTGQPDCLVAFYVSLLERYDARHVGSGVPFSGPRFRGGWGSGGYDAWAEVPYTQSTLIIDIIDARTNQLMWRGYNQDPINLDKTEKDFTKAVDEVLKKFYEGAKRSSRSTH